MNEQLETVSDQRTNEAPRENFFLYYSEWEEWFREVGIQPDSNE